jgi:hypothetical protein
MINFFKEHAVKEVVLAGGINKSMMFTQFRPDFKALLLLSKLKSKNDDSLLRAFAEEVVLPLARSVGDLWALGKIPIAGEHLASEVVVHALKGGLRMSRGLGPLVVCGCLPGERHEWGFLATLAVIQEDGWRIHYLGADLPVREVVEAAWKLSPRAVAFSSSDPAIVRANLQALASLPAKLPPNTVAAIGGGGVEPHARALRGYGFRIGLEAFGKGRS